jgi:cyanophycinase
MADTSVEGPRGAWRWWPLRCLFLFFVLTLAYGGCQVAGQLLPRRMPWIPPAALAVGVALGGALVVISLYRVLVRWTERRRVRELGATDLQGGAARGVLIGVALFSTVYGVLVALGIASFQGWNGTEGLTTAFAMSLLSGVGEEIVFRGVVFRVIEEGSGTLVALLLSGALFGLIHAGNHGATWISTTAIALEAGVLLASAYVMTRSLWLPMGLHFGWNFAEGGIFGAAVSGGTAHGLFATQLSGPDWLTGGAFGPEASVVAVGVCVALALVMAGVAFRRGHWRPLAFRLRTPPAAMLGLACLVAAAAPLAQAPPAPATVHRTTPAYDDYLTGNPADVTAPTRGGLQLEGGGTDIPDAFRWLIDHAGGGDIVVIRASGADGYNPFIMKLGRVDSVESIVFKSRQAASDPAIIRTLEHAEAVFIAGGDQSKYVTYWQGTPVEATLNALASRGVPIGGTSAGLAVLGDVGYSALHASVTSKTALADPYSPDITLEHAFLAMPNMAGIITDSHVGARDRLGRTLVFLARMIADGWASPARAIAVDQESAVLVETDGSATVVGRAPTYFLETTQAPSVCRPGTPLTMAGVAAYRVTAGDTFNLKTWTGRDGTPYVLSVNAGVVTSSIGKIY